ncbi:unnamed protein product [Mesocestoides corti]|uniref:Helicase ATP-binding domain-containing protein n=1 Tax=Mesocestoides corti TaxID=53468 RepID=A0A0R3UC74_MESCO|nr:unnamed protein product [Mesocestoides corti]
MSWYGCRKTFGDDVGLVTRDISVSVNARILIMTTEILLKMVRNASIADIVSVIMDEEQLLLMLLQNVTLVLLSATLPNVVEFADWLGRARGGSEIHVCQTLKRPVPLQQYLYTGRDRRIRNKLPGGEEGRPI